MAAIMRKPSVGAMVLALLMLLFGFLMFLFGYFALSEWRSERAALIACGVVWILTGSAVFGSALWLFVSLGRGPLALRIEGTAIVASGTVLATAAAVGVLPWPGLTARKTDFRWKSNPDRRARVEKGKRKLVRVRSMSEMAI